MRLLEARPIIRLTISPTLCVRSFVTSLLMLVKALNNGLMVQQLETLQLPLLRGEVKIGDSYSMLIFSVLRRLRRDSMFSRLLTLLLLSLVNECGQTRHMIVSSYYMLLRSPLTCLTSLCVFDKTYDVIGIGFMGWCLGRDFRVVVIGLRDITGMASII